MPQEDLVGTVVVVRQVSYEPPRRRLLPPLPGPPGAGVVVERQERECREQAARLGWQVAGVYVDNDVSASTGRPPSGLPPDARRRA